MSARRKYEFTGLTKEWCGITLRQIRALIAIERFGVQVGEIGGWINDEARLSQEGDAWVFGDAQVFGNARVSGNAQVSGNAWVFGDARVFGAIDLMQVGPIGSRNETLSVWRENGGLRCATGCFSGSLDDLATAVDRTHGGNAHGRAYRAAIEMIRARMETPEVAK